LARYSRTFSAQEYRTEHDLLGEKNIPADAYYGIQAARGMKNFQISGLKINHHPELVNALALVKLAAVLESGKGILELVREKKLLSDAEIEKLLDPKSMTGQK